MLLGNKRKRVSHPVGGERLVDSSQAEGLDVNNIVRSFVRTGLMPQRQGGRYEDVSSHDYMAMRNFIADKEAMFGGLPARVRARFGGDPYQLLRFVENPENRAEAVKLGLIDEKTPPQTRMRFEGQGEPPEGGETPLHEDAGKADDEANPRPKKPTKGGKA